MDPLVPIVRLPRSLRTPLTVEPQATKTGLDRLHDVTYEGKSYMRSITEQARRHRKTGNVATIKQRRA